MQHSTRRARPWFLLGAGLGTLGFFCAAVFLGRYALTHARASGDSLHFAAMLGWTTTTALMGGAFAALLMATLCGPPRKPARVIVSQERIACYALLVVTFFSGSFAASIRRSLDMAGDKAPLAGHWMFWGLAALAVFCALGTLSAAYELVSRNRSRLHMPERIVYAGQVLEVQLEIPFAAHSAPRVEAQLSLTYSWSEPGIGEQGHSEERQLWAGSCEVDEWVPSGPRACRATLRVETCAGTPADFGAPHTNYYWTLSARSVTAGRTYRGSFLVPIAFEDAYQEGLIATPGHARSDAA